MRSQAELGNERRLFVFFKRHERADAASLGQDFDFFAFVFSGGILCPQLFDFSASRSLSCELAVSFHSSHGWGFSLTVTFLCLEIRFRSWYESSLFA